MDAIVSDEGHVTIPQAVRDKLDLRPGTVLDIEAVDGQLVARKRSSSDAFAKWRGRGKIPGGVSVDDYLKLTRGRE